MDIGSRIIGIALSDPLALTAQPVASMRRRSGLEEVIDQLVAVIAKTEAEELVIGLPRHLDGRPGEQSIEAEKIGAMLADKTGVKVVYWDERLTTVMANRALLEADISRKKRKLVIDKVAAVLILQNYLEYRRQRMAAESPQQI